jgi:hypothetical protein
MHMRRLARCVLISVLALAVAPGCEALHQYRPVAVLARDAETKQPIPGAEVRITYPLSQSSWAPLECSRTTGNDGIARLQAAPYGDAGILLEGAAKGYVPEERNLAAEEVQAIKPTHLFEAVDRRPVDFVVELYAEPRPTVELVIPTGYRGQVAAEVQIQDGGPWPRGQRDFSYVVPAGGGPVPVIGPPVLRHVFPLDFRGKYADGTPLSAEAKEQEIGFWWLRTEGRYQYFLVGTRRDYDDYRHASQDEKRERHSEGGGRGEGRGRRGHRGNQSTPDAGQAGANP